MYHYTWLENIPGVRGVFESIGIENASPILHSWMICFVLIGLALAGRFALARVTAQNDLKKYVPDATLTLRNVWEIFAEGLVGLLKGVLEHQTRNPVYFGLLAGLFVYILSSNLVGLVPGFAAPTSDISTNLAMALVVLIVFNVAGLLENGFGYVKHLFGPVALLAPLIFTVEVISLFLVRPISLTLRLGGNMFGDHMVFGIMSDLVPLVLPVIFLGLGAFVSFIQALVFTLLSAVYIALATAHEDDHH
ncbi:MAG: F0F1 ATP synthase subunit A [Myxococcota bacterium]